MISPSIAKNKSYFPLGLMAFLAISFLACYFFRERVAFLDAAYQLFMLIYKGDFAIQSGRFGAVVTQVFPLISVKLGLSLKMVMISYSLSFILFPLFLFLALSQLFRNLKMALALLLFQLLMVTHTFYWVQSELLQACTLVLFFWGMVWSKKGSTFWLVPLFGALITVIVFIHPLAIIPFLFCWCFTYLSFPQKAKLSHVIGFLLIIVLFVKYTFIPISTYDSSSFQHGKNLWQFYNFFSFISTRRFFKYCLTDYYLFTLLFLWINFFYYKKKEFLKLGLVFAFTLGHLILVNTALPWGPPQFHMESFYRILSIFVIIPLLYDVLPGTQWKKKNSPLVILLFIILARIGHIGFEHKAYSDRLSWMETLLTSSQQWSGRTFMIKEDEVPLQLVINGWGSPFETLLLSAMEHPDSARSLFIYNNDIDIDAKNKKRETLLTPFSDLPFETLPQTYFRLRDSSPYRSIQPADLPVAPN